MVSVLWNFLFHTGEFSLNCLAVSDVFSAVFLVVSLCYHHLISSCQKVSNRKLLVQAQFLTKMNPHGDKRKVMGLREKKTTRFNQ